MLPAFATAAAVGIIATFVFDVWALLLRAAVGVPAPDWGLLGRWTGHLLHGQIEHPDIRQSKPIGHEGIIGWMLHYTVGAFFGLGLLVAVGSSWFKSPSIGPALFAGLATLAGIWLVLMPLFGSGIAGRKMPNANRVRAINVLSHIVFGVGFYIGALLMRGFATQS